jgi:hypothetical protein
MHARVPSAAAAAGGPAAALSPSPPGRTFPPTTGGELLALALNLRARELRGLDVLRRSQNRAPPTVR